MYVTAQILVGLSICYPILEGLSHTLAFLETNRAPLSMVPLSFSILIEFVNEKMDGDDLEAMRRALKVR